MPEIHETPSVDECLKQLRREKFLPLFYDVEITQAVENDRPRELYRLLLKKRKLDGMAERPLLDELLANRRLFGEALKKPPTMHTINGCGTSLHGNAEEDKSNCTYIATLFITLVFIPIFPLASYLVMPAQSGGWYFLRKVPLNRTMRLWRQLTAACLIAAACLTAGLVYHSQTYTKIHLVNALDVPVQVQFDQSAPLKVDPGSVKEITSVHRGRHHITARTISNKVIEELDVEVPARQDVIAYNVLGAAPLFAKSLIYYTDGKAPPNAKDERGELHQFC
jgi:hypothetical protein